MFSRMHGVVGVLAAGVMFWSAGTAALIGAEASTNGVQLEASGTPDSPIPGLKLDLVPETWLTFGLNRIPILKQAVLGNPLW